MDLIDLILTLRLAQEGTVVDFVAMLVESLNDVKPFMGKEGNELVLTLNIGGGVEDVEYRGFHLLALDGVVVNFI